MPGTLRHRDKFIALSGAFDAYRDLRASISSPRRSDSAGLQVVGLTITQVADHGHNLTAENIGGTVDTGRSIDVKIDRVL